MQRLILALGLFILIVGCAVFVYSRLLRERAQSILRTTYELCEERQIPTVVEIRQHLGSRLQLDQCRGTECEYKVTLSNRVLAALHVVPYTELQSYFWTRDGTLLFNMLDYTTTVDHGHRVVTHIQTDFCKGCQKVDIHPWDATSPLDTNGLVGIGSEATAQRRRIVLSINTDCLTGFRECRTIADLLPAVWKQTADGRIACTIENDQGWVR